MDDQTIPTVLPTMTQMPRVRVMSAKAGVATLILAAFSLSSPAAAEASTTSNAEGVVFSELTTNRQHLTSDPSAAVNALLKLVNERLNWMPAVAQSKQLLNLPIEDPARERMVLSSALKAVTLHAQAAGLEAPESDAILNFYSAQIEAAKTLQRRWIQQQNSKQNRINTSTEAQRRLARNYLNREIRPVLLQLGEKMALLIVQISADPNLRKTEINTFILKHHELPENQVRNLIQAIQAL